MLSVRRVHGVNLIKENVAKGQSKMLSARRVQGV